MITLDSKGWTVENPDEDKTWELAIVGGNEPGGMAAYMNIKSYSGFGERDKLISPIINLSDYNEAKLEFQFAYAQRFPQYTDSLIVYISLDCGTELIRLLALGEDTANMFATAPPTTNAFYPASPDHWCGSDENPQCASIDLTDWVGNPNVQIVFESYNGYGNNIFVDNVTVEGTLSSIKNNQTEFESAMVYPNPSQGKFTIAFFDFDQEVTVSLMDLNGKVLFTDLVDCGSRTCFLYYDGEFLAKGVYLLNIQSGTNRITKKIILK
jgi:hypothetical protein